MVLNTFTSTYSGFVYSYRSFDIILFIFTTSLANLSEDMSGSVHFPETKQKLFLTVTSASEIFLRGKSHLFTIMDHSQTRVRTSLGYAMAFATYKT